MRRGIGSLGGDADTSDTVIKVGASPNQAEISMKGSVIRFDFPVVLQISKVITTAGSNQVSFQAACSPSCLWIFTGAGSVHIGRLPVIDGITLTGHHNFVSAFDHYDSNDGQPLGVTEFKVTVGQTATGSSETTISARAKVVKQKQIDLADTGTAFTSAVLNPLHTNSVQFD